MSQYIVSARKYRPDSFESLIGQDNIARTLKNSILRGQLAHAYLFCGPRGVGKTTTARIFAKMINCSHPTADMEPCGECESCTSFQEGRSYCIHELDAASNNGVEDIKALMDQVMVPPQVGKYSVYIIDEVHMLSTQAFNAFLKTLEEPPAHAIFILATTEKHKIIPTILSRCQTYDFNRISVPDIVRNLRDIAAKESVKIDDESLHIIAKKADGAMRDALTIFDQTVAFCGTDIKCEDVMRNLNVLDYEFCFSLVRDFLAGDYGHALLTFDEILSKGFNALHFISSLSSHLRDLLVARTGGLETLLDLPDSLKKQYREQAQSCSVKFIYDALSVTTQCEAGYKASVNQRLHIEFALMKLCFLQNQPAATASTPEGAALPSEERATLGIVRGGTASEASGGVGGAEGSADVRRGEVPASGAEIKAEAPKRSRAKTGASLSLSSLMNGGKQEQQEEKAPETVKAASAISDEEIKAKWGELADTISQPRLSSALRNAKLEIGGDDSQKVVSFAVMNDAQRKWIEENKLRELEAGFRSLTGCGTIRLEVGVVPDEHEGEKKVYMPVEKAQDLMQDNSEVRDLVVDLGLDIK